MKAFLAFLVLSALASGAPSLARAQPAGDAASLDVAQSMADNLRRLAATKKPVEIVLRNGKSFKGKLGAVGDRAVVVAEIVGREFYDALVLIDEIVAVEVRAR